MESPSFPEVKYVTQEEMRKLFKNHSFLDRIQRGELTPCLKGKARHVSNPSHTEHCSMSQMVYYFDRQGRPLVLAHQYVRSDGTLGASGLPDPKRLQIGDIVYKLLKSRV